MGSITKYYRDSLSLKEMKRNVLYGKYMDFEITIYVKTISRALISFYASDEFKQRLIDELKSPEDNGYIKYKSDNLGLEISVVSLTKKKAMRILMEKVQMTLTRLHELMVKSNCVASGGYDLDGTEKIKIVNKRYISLNNKGIDLLVYKREERERMIKAIPPHYVLGALGIILGTLASLIVWLTLDVSYLFSPVACAFSIIVGDLLYMHFGGRNDRYKLIMLATIPLALTLVLTFATYLGYSAIEISKEGLDISAISYLMTTYHMRVTFISRIVFNSIFTLIGFGLISAGYYHSYLEHRIKISDLPEKKKEEAPEI